MTAPICARLATDSGASNLIVTHLSDPTDSAITMEKIHREFTGTVYLAYPGLAIELEQ
jgi:ribonuclease BN (tRNA processing enzyme)